MGALALWSKKFLKDSSLFSHGSLWSCDSQEPLFITGSSATVSVFWALPADSPLSTGLLIALEKPWLQPLLRSFLLAHTHQAFRVIKEQPRRSSLCTRLPAPLKKVAGARKFMTDAVKSSEMQLDVFGIQTRRKPEVSLPHRVLAALLCRPSLHHACLLRCPLFLLPSPARFIPISLWYRQHLITNKM